MKLVQENSQTTINVLAASFVTIYILILHSKAN